MRRKYDIRNKRNFIIILILSLIIIGIFSLFIYKYNHASKIEYIVKTGSVVQDSSKNFVKVEEDALLKVRWNGSYYLEYQDNNVSLGKKVIVYDTITGDIKLYGKYYEIEANGKIVPNDNETVLDNTGNTKFYKLDDREYLLVDKQITSTDESINASGYLLVELDRMGNAKISNYRLNLKTINPTTLMTSLYSFDIANEKLKYNNLEIDLKKIIGSSNQYEETTDDKKDNDKKDDNEIENTTGNNSGNTSIGTNTGTIANGSGNSSTGVNNTNQGDNVTLEEIRKDTKITSIIRTDEGLSQIDIDYVVYDPYNEYKSVYAEINKDGKIETVNMSKTDTHLIFSNLMPYHEYKIEFYYTTIDSDTKETIITKFESMVMKTKKPEYAIKIYKISSITNVMDYRVYLQEGYNINKIKITLSFDYYDIDNEVRRANITKEYNVNDGDKVLKLAEFIDPERYNIVSNTLFRLNIDSVSNGNETIIINSYDTFRLGR